MTQTITLNTNKMLLSSSRRIYKTEGFVSDTRKIVAIDTFISRVAESVFYDLSLENGHYLVETADKRYTLFFRIGSAHDARLKIGDIVFYKFVVANSDGEGGVDRTLWELLTQVQVALTVRETTEIPTADEFLRIYLVADGDGVNFPLLNETQRKIVQTENANMLVQGIAGSGKTNVCVEKIVYCACRSYRGKVLYTTFSRGLLTETQNRVGLFLKNILDFIKFYQSGNVVFLDDNHKKAVENKLGILFSTDDDAEIVNTLKNIADFLQNKVEYKLIEDIYSDYFNTPLVADEKVFLQEYIGGKNCRLSGALEKIKHIAGEIVYKEIYGMIFGKYELGLPSEMMSREEYAEARRDSFSRAECDVIYSVAVDYLAYLNKNGLTDNNLMSRQLLNNIQSPIYSVGIIDEVQDFTQVNLCLIKQMCRKMFCVGDALQMINPSYFNFGYLKRLMYGDVTGVAELKHNYRSTQAIEQIAQKLGELNIRRFGTHSFVLRGHSVHSSLETAAVFVQDKAFADNLKDKRLENITVIVSSQKKKEELRRKLPKTEILTVAEAKGLERSTVVLVDVLTDNIDKWQYLEHMALNRKTADENSVFRYYFNLFYVGISRAKQFLFVCEGQYPQVFEEVFQNSFNTKTPQNALQYLVDVAGKIEIDDDELVDRIEKFCSLEQYENAAFAADRISSDAVRNKQLAYIYVHQNFLRYGKYRDAGVEYWRRGLDEEARAMFTRSGDEKLFPLMDACKNGGGALDVEIVRFFPLVEDNELAQKLIVETVNNDYNSVANKQQQINATLKRRKK